VGPDGVTSFSIIQLASDSGNAAALVFFLFDLLYLDGEDLCPRPLIERKARLAGLHPCTTAITRPGAAGNFMRRPAGLLPCFFRLIIGGRSVPSSEESANHRSPASGEARDRTSCVNQHRTGTPKVFSGNGFGRRPALLNNGLRPVTPRSSRRADRSHAPLPSSEQVECRHAKRRTSSLRRAI
jgi:hypothetical protein